MRRSASRLAVRRRRRLRSRSSRRLFANAAPASATILRSAFVWAASNARSSPHRCGRRSLNRQDETAARGNHPGGGRVAPDGLSEAAFGHRRGGAFFGEFREAGGGGGGGAG